jgi:hypothetical protein
VAFLLAPANRSFVFYALGTLPGAMALVTRYVFHAGGIIHDLEHLAAGFAVPSVFCAGMVFVSWLIGDARHAGRILRPFVWIFRHFPAFAATIYLVFAACSEGLFGSSDVQWLQVVFDWTGLADFLAAHATRLTRRCS